MLFLHSPASTKRGEAQTYLTKVVSAYENLNKLASISLDIAKIQKEGLKDLSNMDSIKYGAAYLSARDSIPNREKLVGYMQQKIRIIKHLNADVKLTDLFEATFCQLSTAPPELNDPITKGTEQWNETVAKINTSWQILIPLLVVEKTTTSVDGKFQFDKVSPGEYTLFSSINSNNGTSIYWVLPVASKDTDVKIDLFNDNALISQ